MLDYNYQVVPDHNVPGDVWFLPSAMSIVEGRNQSDITISENNLNISHNKNITRRSLLGCAEIAGLEIVRELGRGMLKTTFVVKLPWGGHAVAKRCKNYRCYEENLIKREANMLQKLYEQYNDEGALQFFGECYIPFDELLSQPNRKDFENKTTKISNKNNLLIPTIRDFSVGFTSVIELGKPFFIRNEKTYRMEPGCFAGFFTPRDIEDLKNIARRYANLSDYPLLLSGWNNKVNDNRFPNQYITRIGGGQRGGEGTINHADLDMAYHCKDSGEKECTVDNVLKRNCEVIAKMVNISSLDCSFPSASDTNNTAITSKVSLVSVDTPDYSERINATYAIEQCLIKGLGEGEEDRVAKMRAKKMVKKMTEITMTDSFYVSQSHTLVDDGE